MRVLGRAPGQTSEPVPALGTQRAYVCQPPGLPLLRPFREVPWGPVWPCCQAPAGPLLSALSPAPATLPASLLAPPPSKLTEPQCVGPATAPFWAPLLTGSSRSWGCGGITGPGPAHVWFSLGWGPGPGTVVMSRAPGWPAFWPWQAAWSVAAVLLTPLPAGWCVPPCVWAAAPSPGQAAPACPELGAPPHGVSWSTPSAPPASLHVSQIT